jgi:hypothetical protein
MWRERAAISTPSRRPLGSSRADPRAHPADAALRAAGDDLEGVAPVESGGRGWRIPMMHAVHDRERPPRIEEEDRPPEPPGGGPLRLSEGRLELIKKIIKKS